MLGGAASWDFTKAACLQEKHSAEIYAEIQSTRYVCANLITKTENSVPKLESHLVINYVCISMQLTSRVKTRTRINKILCSNYITVRAFIM